MVSGFFTSPYDHERIRSGEASAILIESKSSVWRCWLKRLSKSFMSFLLLAGCLLHFFQLDVDTERTNFLDQHVEGLGHARDHLVIAVDDVLVHLAATGHVGGLHRQHFLQ